MRTTKNIKDHQFKKGSSGNPEGRPKGTRSAKSVLSKYLEMPLILNDPEDQFSSMFPEYTNAPNLSAIELGALRLIYCAINSPNPVRAYNAILDRIEGRAPQALKIEKEPIRISVILPDFPSIE